MGWFGLGRKQAAQDGTPSAVQDLGPRPEGVQASTPLVATGSQDAATGAFTLPIEDVFTITGRGTVVTGRVAGGSVTVGDEVAITRDGTVVVSTRVTGVEMFRKVVQTAAPGDNVGLLLEKVRREDVRPGDVVTR